MKREQGHERSAQNEHRLERVHEGAERRFERERRDLHNTELRHRNELSAQLHAAQQEHGTFARQAREKLSALFARQTEELAAQQERERGVLKVQQSERAGALKEAAPMLADTHVEQIRSLEHDRTQLHDRQTSERRALREELTASVRAVAQPDRGIDSWADAARRDEATLAAEQREATRRDSLSEVERRVTADAAARVDALRGELTEKFVGSYVEREVMAREEAERVAENLLRAVPTAPPGDLEALAETVRALMDAAVRVGVEQGLNNAQHNELGITAHRYAEFLLDQLNAQLMATDRRVGVFAEQFLAAKQQDAWVGATREKGMRGVDAVIYQEGEAVRGIDLKTGRHWSKRELEAIQDRFGIVVEQHAADGRDRRTR